jgi:hypothetical protein
MFFLISCQSKITCNKPYILVGNDCCLDMNDNSICDKDEILSQKKQISEEKNLSETETIIEKDTLPETEIIMDITLCGNGVLDIGETCTSCPEDVNCTEGTICCDSICKKIACIKDHHCVSTDAMKTGRCINQGSCEAECVFEISPEKVKSQAMRLLAYSELFRNNEQYIGKPILYIGELWQEILGEGYRIAVTPDSLTYPSYWEDVVWVNYETKEKFLENDIIEVVGIVKGLMSYQGVDGGMRQIPEIDAVSMRIITKAEKRR